MRFRRIVLAVSLLAMLFAVPAAAKGPASGGGTSGACPASPKNFVPSSIVGASFSNSGNTTTYFFQSLTDESPIVGGVPGLIKYCVYPGGPKTVTPLAMGDNGQAWLSRKDTKNFSFVRPDGNPSNIGLDDGPQITMGMATWTDLPATQTILLHINDPTECELLYGDSVLNVSGTCFVKPSTGPICDAGSGATGVAYNALPFGVENCRSASLGFEATGSNEFGDEVTLKTGTPRVLDKLLVSFNSWACQSGSWFGGNCVSAAGATFTHPITANIYAGDNCTTAGCIPGALLATTTVTQTIPYRPSHDPSCPASGAGDIAGSGWVNPAGVVNAAGNKCYNYIVRVLTFTGFTKPGGGAPDPLPDNVIWTVEFDTSHSGYKPLLCDPIAGCPTLNPTPPACEGGPGGCPFDSLNVGDQNFPGAPYAGTDIDNDVVFLSFYLGAGVPASYPPPFGSGVLQNLASVLLDPNGDPFTGFRPLGEIITTP